MDDNKKEPNNKEYSYKEILEEILKNQKKSQNLSKIIIIFLFALIIIKLFVIG